MFVLKGDRRTVEACCFVLLMQTSQNIVIALFNVNTPELYNILSALPRSIRVISYHLSTINIVFL